MANNQKKLKAFVRYDGSGRVVASSLILRKNKPRVGRWYQIPEYLCCNGTTGTTTTQGGGSGPTAWVLISYATSEVACMGMMGTTDLVYTASNTLSNFTSIWSDAALTIPWQPNPFSGFQPYLVFPGDTTRPNGVWTWTGGFGTFIYDFTPCTTTTTTTTAPVYREFTTNSSYAASGTICGTSNVFDVTRYFIGAGSYPVAGDTVYAADGLGGYYPYGTGPGSYGKMSNNSAYSSSDLGLVLDVFSC
jgi:hypothetical protein